MLAIDFAIGLHLVKRIESLSILHIQIEGIVKEVEDSIGYTLTNLKEITQPIAQ